MREFCPYKPHVGAFVGEYVSDVFDIAYRDMSDTCGLGVLKPMLEHGKLAFIRGACGVCFRDAMRYGRRR